MFKNLNSTFGLGKLSLIIVLVPLFLIACTDVNVGFYRPNTNFSAKEYKNNIVANGKLRITNAQPSETIYKLQTGGIEVNNKEFSQAIVDVLKVQYQKQGVILADDATKELQIKVTRVSMEEGISFRAHIFCYVTLGDGPDVYFHATRASYNSPFMRATFPTKPLDAAFENLILKILNNDKVRAFIEL